MKEISGKRLRKQKSLAECGQRTTRVTPLSPDYPSSSLLLLLLLSPFGYKASVTLNYIAHKFSVHLQS